MNTKQALEVIVRVKNRYADEELIFDTFTEIELMVALLPEYNQQQTIEFIRSKMSGKLGGMLAILTSRLEYLILELKAENKKHKLQDTRERGYIDSLDLDMSKRINIENLLLEFENGKISRDEYLALTYLSHKQSYGAGHDKGFSYKNK